MHLLVLCRREYIGGSVRVSMTHRAVAAWHRLRLVCSTLNRLVGPHMGVVLRSRVRLGVHTAGRHVGVRMAGGGMAA